MGPQQAAALLLGFGFGCAVHTACACLCSLGPLPGWAGAVLQATAWPSLWPQMVLRGQGLLVRRRPFSSPSAAQAAWRASRVAAAPAAAGPPLSLSRPRLCRTRGACPLLHLCTGPPADWPLASPLQWPLSPPCTSPVAMESCTGAFPGQVFACLFKESGVGRGAPLCLVDAVLIAPHLLSLRGPVRASPGPVGARPRLA